MGDDTSTLEKLQRIKQAALLKRADAPNDKQIVKKGIKSTYPKIPDSANDKLSSQIMHLDNDATLKMGQDKVRVDDLLFSIATSLENTDSGIGTHNEYLEWIDETKEILYNMNDGEITDKDINQREGFVKDSFNREAELMVCIGLYEKSASPEAKQKAAELKYKLLKLREMRSIITQYTKSKTFAKVEQERQEEEKKENAETYSCCSHDHNENNTQSQSNSKDDDSLDGLYAVLGLGLTASVSAEVLRRYGIDHTNDFDLKNNYDWEKRLRENIERADLNAMNSYDRAISGRIVENRINNTSRSKEQIAEHLAQITERRAPVHNDPRYNYNEARKLAFNVDKFHQVSNNR